MSDLFVNNEQKNPPKDGSKSIQYDLFSRFVTNNEKDVSNTIHFWETIPKYFFTKDLMEKLRQPTGHADPFTWDFPRGNTSCKIVISPALIEQSNGSYKAFFPSVTEEIIEEALKKIIADQRQGFHDVREVETWVFFTWKMLQKELKDKGKSRSIQEIKHAIAVLNECNLKYYENDKLIWRGAILQDLTTIGRDDYLEDTSRHHAARLPVYISHAINKHEIRQFNYRKYMGFKRPLARWIFKRLVHRYPQASMTEQYSFKYSDLKIESGLLQQKTEDKNRKKAVEAIIELVDRNVLFTWSAKYKKDKSNKICDVVYTVYASSEFTKEQTAAHKRFNNAKIIARENGLAILDKPQSK